jgi:hypothetical protein
MSSLFNEDYINDIVGTLQNKLNDGLQHISNPLTGQINPTCKTILDEIEYPCYIPGKNGAKKTKKKIQIQLVITRDEEEFLD